MKQKKYFAVNSFRPSPDMTRWLIACSFLITSGFTSEENKATIMDDPFIRFYIGDLLRTLRTQYLIDLIKPYTRLELEFLARVCVICIVRYQLSLTNQHTPATKCRQG